MKRSIFVFVSVAATAVMSLFAYEIWRNRPPYELGFHSTASNQTARQNGNGPRLGNCPIFPADSVWNTRVDKLPIDPKSETYIAAIGPSKGIHPDFGTSLQYGLPFTEVPAGTRPVQVNFEYPVESDNLPYPLPEGTPLEGNGTGDSHVIAIDLQHCRLYELYGAHPEGDHWTAGSGIAMDLTSNALRDAGKTSADAAGLPIFPGLVRFEEVDSGHIDHALRFTLPRSQDKFIWPARHRAGKPDANLVPMGQRFRLRADFDSSRYSKRNQVIIVALKTYGMFMADNGGAMFLSGVSDKRWNNRDLRKLNGLRADDFEAVDESSLQILPNSGRVDPAFQ